MTKEFSGPQWVTRFPTSNLTSDLLPDFRKRVEAFIDDLHNRGCAVRVSATYRPAERAYLMHYCCMIADAKQDPAAVPGMCGVDIDWTHGGDLVAAKAAATAMKHGYNIAYPAALVSRHTQRRAIDMTITPNPPNVVALGASFGVKKLLSDPPHWSDDGH